MIACLHGSGDLLTLALEFSPIVERISADTVVLDVSGLDRMFGHPQDIAAAIMNRGRERQCAIHIALASNADTAICAARGFSGVSVVPYGDEAKFIETLPVSMLAPSPELHDTLERWGIRRFHELAALPPLGIAERLGPEGLRLRELARGEAERKLVPVVDPLRFEDQIEPDYPIELLEPLAFLLARLLNSLTTSLAARGLATDEIRLRLKLENRTTFERTLRLPVPSTDAKSFLKLWHLDLTAQPPQSPILHIWMAMRPVKPQAAQSGLFVLAAPEPVKLELTLARIKAIVGPDRVGSPELLNTHRPNGFRMVAAPSPALAVAQHSRLMLRLYRPPRTARVALASGQPHFIAADGIRGKVTELAGPWRISGDWWTHDPFSRDEWDIALSDGALYRLYCDPQGWFVDGSYD
jgi:protein ImuB